MPKFQLGQRVRYLGYMRRDKGHGRARWMRYSCPGEGVIGGKRTCTDGHVKDIYSEDGGYSMWWPTKYHSFWLVAPNLSGYRYVAEADIVAVEVPGGAGVDGYRWEAINDHTKQG